MTLFRMIIFLLGALVLLLAVVVQRAETTRLHFDIARCEREADEVRQQLREAELQLARLRNPARIRQRMEQTIAPFLEPPPREKPRDAKPKKSATPREAR